MVSHYGGLLRMQISALFLIRKDFQLNCCGSNLTDGWNAEAVPSLLALPNDFSSGENGAPSGFLRYFFNTLLFL